MFYPTDKLAIFIDGANMHTAARSLGFEIDYKKLLDTFSKRGRLVRASYYTAVHDDTELNTLKPLVDWLDYNGYNVVTKPTKSYTDVSGMRRIKGNMDIEIAVDMMLMADKVDHIVLFSGDGDFRRLIECVQRKGTHVTVISTVRSNPPVASDDLRRQADEFIDLEELRELIGREQRVLGGRV